ncbi:MAG: Ig-like domain-containing protein [Spirochaetia bacterium]|nr:Ig-like domain-containing protein [Spirochaetia bacterium]
MKLIHSAMHPPTGMKQSSLLIRGSLSSFLLLILAAFSFYGCKDQSQSDGSSALLALLGSPSAAMTSTPSGGLDQPENSTEVNAPYIQNMSPFNNSLTSVHSSISIQFGRPVQPGSVTVNTTNQACTGSVRISRDNFASCVRMAPLPASIDGNLTFILSPAEDLDGGIEYRVSIRNEIVGLSGLHLSTPQTTTFRTRSLDSKSFQVLFPAGIFRSSFLTNPDPILTIRVRPDAPGRVIRQIVTVPRFRDENGTFTHTEYQGHTNLDTTYFSDVTGAKTIQMQLTDFAPGLASLETWNHQKTLEIGIALVYSDGANANNLNDANSVVIALVNDGPSFDAFSYGILAFIDVSAFVASPSELPKAQWNSWIEVIYPDASLSKSDPELISLDSEGGAYSFVGSRAWRPKAGLHETVKLHIDSNGNGLPDYTWIVPDSNLNGDFLFPDALGIREDGVNIVGPVLVPGLEQF